MVLVSISSRTKILIKCLGLFSGLVAEGLLYELLTKLTAVTARGLFLSLLKYFFRPIIFLRFLFFATSNVYKYQDIK